MLKWYHRLRWLCMTLSFFFFVFGLQLFGKWIHSVEFPILACPGSSDQMVHNACYNLSHLKAYFQYHSMKEIITYFLTLLVVIVLFGRMFCGFICPMGYFQDIAYQVREILHIDGITRKEKFMQTLKVAKYIILLVFLGISFIGFDFCSICPAAVDGGIFAGFSHAITVAYIFAAVLFVLSFFMRRFWCTICPVGYLVGIFHKISIFQVKKNCKSCTKCGACYEACPMKIKSIYTEEEKEKVTTSECIFCGECVRKCPENCALKITAGPITLCESSREGFLTDQVGRRKFAWLKHKKNLQTKSVLKDKKSAI